MKQTGVDPEFLISLKLTADHVLMVCGREIKMELKKKVIG